MEEEGKVISYFVMTEVTVLGGRMRGWRNARNGKMKKKKERKIRKEG